MTTVYKLTDENMRTYKGFRWELGKEYTTNGEGDLCGSGWLHCYNDPLVAILLNPIHANFKNPRLFRAKVKGKGRHDHGLKSGYTSMTLVEELAVPAITTEQRVRFAILCTMEVYKGVEYTKWANRWLSGEDRSEAAAARAAARAAWAVEAEAARRRAARVAAARAAWAVEVAAARRLAARRLAARVAARAAWAAAEAADIDLNALAQKACDAP